MHTLRLYAIVLRLAALRPGAVPPDHGDQARAALFDLIDRGNSALAAELHDTNMHKPYTISLLQGGQRGRDGALHFGAGHTADWRFTLLCEPAFEALLRRYLLNRDLPHVRIGAVTFAVVDAFATGRSHPDSGHTSVSELQARWNQPPEVLPSSIGLEFRSPTAFNLGTDAETGRRRFSSLPEARHIFSTLRKRWAEIGGAEPGDEFDQWAQEHLLMEPRGIRTQRVRIEKTSFEGFTGRVCFRAGSDQRWLALAHLLAELAFWTGIGYQTTRGLGQARRLAIPGEIQ